MDALQVRFVFIAAALFIFAGCSQTKNSGTVFPETSLQCQKSAHPTRYMVKKETGDIEILYKSSREEMMEDYVKPNLSEIAFVEQDQYVQKDQIATVQPTAATTWGPERIGATVAWNQNIQGQNVLVAVIDSGTDISHPAIAHTIFVNSAEANGTPGVDDDGNGYIDDVSGWNFATHQPQNIDEEGHGTHVAGIIAGAHSSPVLGVAPQAKILPLDFMNIEGGFTSDGIQALRYAVKMGAQVINASWGSPGCSSLLKQEIENLVEANILFVSAAGNYGRNLAFFPQYPAVYQSDSKITVSALSTRGFMASFSNYGTPSNIMAPGEAIYSSVPGNDYKFFNGTSMAAPMVSGVAALLISHQPNIRVATLRKIILDSVIKGAFDVSSRGEVNVPAALQLQSQLSP